MKYLSDYMDEEQTKLFEELGVFFAFSDAQFEEGVAKNKHKKPAGTKWASFGMGMYMPSINTDEFERRHEELVKNCIKRDIAENGKEAILQRELMNYEIGLSYEGINDPNFRDGIKGYGFTKEEIRAGYDKIMREVEW